MTTIEKLTERNLLTIKDNKVLLSPMHQYGFTTYPLTENMPILAVTEDEYLGLLTGVSMFDKTLTKVVDFVEPTIIDATQEEIK